jgi:hypothetical protein
MKLVAFYAHLRDLARGEVKDPAECDAQLETTPARQTEIRELLANAGA